VPDQTSSATTLHHIRYARAADLKQIAGIEESGAALIEEAFGDLTDDPLLAPVPSGGERLDAPGLLLVVGPVGDPYGFAHIVIVDGYAHLAQLSVRPDRARQGWGTALVQASMREAWHLGYDRLSLATYRDLAWNGPLYAGLGFTEETHLRQFEVEMRRREIALGLDRHGPRIVMSVALRPGLPASQLASGP
jgi:GNAT superfamily N-acetyltransferase